MTKIRKIVFENGREFSGYPFGTDSQTVSEVVFCTSMVGYQEVLTNPAYKGKIVLFTYPIIGSYGLSDEDYESGTMTASGVIVREYNDFPSNFRYTKTLSEEMQECSIPGIYGVDTREIVQMLREEGIMKAAIVDEDTNRQEIKRLLQEETYIPSISDISSKKTWYSRTSNYRYNVVAIDCGITSSMIKSLKSRGCNIIIVPYNSSQQEIYSYRPHGIYISDGPGYPKDADVVVNTIKGFIGKMPILGVGFGFLAIASAFDGRVSDTQVMHFGSNHPVRNLINSKIEITSQSHSHIIDENSIKDSSIKITHRNLTDNTIEGISLEDKSISAIAYHPECTVDDTDTAYIYDNFIESIEREGIGKDDNNA